MKQMIVAVMFLLALAVATHPATALGVSPAGKLVEYTPGEQVTFVMRVMNNEHKDIDVVMKSTGPYAANVRIMPSSVSLNSDDEYGEATVVFTVPDGLEPGLNIISIEATGYEPASGQISALVSVVSQIRVNVPVPGKNAKAALHISEADRNQQVAFQISVLNTGTDGIRYAAAQIEVLGPGGQSLGMLSTGAAEIPSGEERKLTALWEGTGSRGEYSSVANLVYDSESLSLTQPFEVGEREMTVSGIASRDFRLGRVNAVDFGAYLDWNTGVGEAYAEFVLQPGGAAFKSDTSPIAAGESRRITAYWDTAGVEKGAYEMTVTAHHDGRTNSITVPVWIYEDAAAFGQWITPAEEEHPEFVIIILAAIALFVAASLYLSWKRKSL